MEEEKDYICLCPHEGLMNIMSKKWSLFILTVIGSYGKLRFGEIKKKLKIRSSKTLSDTLKALNDTGLITRENFAEIPPRVEYALTKEGSELREMIIPMMRWASRRDCIDPKNCVKIRTKRNS